MSQTRFSTSGRTAQALSASGLALLTAALVVSPASAVDDCDAQAADAADYAAELACASVAADGAQTITLTDSFEVPAAAENRYFGSYPLTIVGAHEAVTITGPGRDSAGTAEGDGVFLEVSRGQVEPQAQEAEPLPAGYNPDVTVANLTLTNFSSAGTVLNSTYSALQLSEVAIVGNGVLVTPGGEGSFPAGAAVSSLGEVVIEDSAFEDNAGALGGAVSTWPVLVSPGPGDEDPQGPPTVTVTDSTFTDNQAVSGAAIFSFGNTEVSGSTFADNVAETGGAIGSFGPVTHVTDSSFIDNLATPLSDAEGYIEGGALAVDGEVTLKNTTLRGNDSEGIGGAIAFSVGAGVPQTSLSIVDSLLEDNVALGSGGAVWFEGGVEVSGSTFMDNGAIEGPAAIAVSAADDDITITNSTFTANASDIDAPAVGVVGAGSVAVTHATFVDNTSAGGAADLSVEDGVSSTLVASVWSPFGDVPSCDIAGDLTTAANFDPDGSCTDGRSGEGDIGEGLSPDVAWTEQIFQGDAVIDNRGPTPTLSPAADSPLVDAVPDGVSDIDVDQRGYPRPQGEAKDIGAVEYEFSHSGSEAGLVEFQVETDAGTILGTATPAIAVTDVAWIPTGELGTPPPADTALPYGAAGFTVEVPEPGDSVTMSLTAPRPSTTLLKSTGGNWSEVDGATFSAEGTTVTYTLTDGGELDEDGEANGFIVDPVALALQATFTG